MIEISEHDSATLIAIARQAIADTVLGRPLAEDASPADVGPQPHSGVFVTVFVDGRLRGCIGNLDPQAPIPVALNQAACSAVSRDFRFSAIEESELSKVTFDITVLEPMESISSEEDLVIGRDGVFIEYLTSRGILLPQVASERNWSPRQFLEAVCEKAGLPRGAWRDSHARCYRFGARKIHAAFPDSPPGS